jgi:hypothetical protein
MEPKGRHLETVEVIEAESQAVLNTLTERDFKNAFNNAEVLEAVHTRVVVASRPKVFDQMAANIPEINGLFFVYCSG